MNAIIKTIILFFSNILHHNHKSKILYYHDVSTKYTRMGTPENIIRRHLSIVAQSGYTLVDEITNRQRQVMICFDDGWAGLYEAKELFLQYKVFPTIFVAVDLIGRPGYLTIGQIQELQDIGFHFEGHTWSHRDLTTFDEKGLKHELLDSKEALTEMLGKDVSALCFPQGRFSKSVFCSAVNAGYSKIYSSIPGSYFDLLHSEGLICRNLVQSVSDSEFRYILNATSRFFVRRMKKLHYQE